MDGTLEEVPWDFARHFADEGYREASEAVAASGRRRFGGRLRALRSEKNMTQKTLAERAGISRVTVAHSADRKVPQHVHWDEYFTD